MSRKVLFPSIYQSLREGKIPDFFDFLAWKIRGRNGNGKSQIECMEGYTNEAGRTPMLPRTASFANVSSMNGCGSLCNVFRHQKTSCCSFEWSPNNKQCNLSPLCEPGKSENSGDFIFCNRGEVMSSYTFGLHYQNNTMFGRCAFTSVAFSY